MKTSASSSIVPGLLFCLAIATAAYFAGTAVPLVGGAVFGIVFGIAAGFFKRPASFAPGVKYSGKKILQYAIILLGFEMQISVVLRVGAQSLWVMLFTLSASFLTAALVSRLFKMPANESILIGVGTSICGGSAIAATAPVIKASDEETAQSISTIFLFNIVAVFLFPALGRLLGLGDVGFGIWAGTAVNDTSSVVATASSWSQAAGNNVALSTATVVKLTRTLMIVPITVVLALYTARKEKRSGALSSYSFAKTFPWFVLGFVATALAASFLPIPAETCRTLAKAGKFLIVVAMSAIGLSANIRKLLTNGRSSLLLGLCCWAAVAVVSLVVQHFSSLI